MNRDMGLVIPVPLIPQIRKWIELVHFTFWICTIKQAMPAPNGLKWGGSHSARMHAWEQQHLTSYTSPSCCVRVNGEMTRSPLLANCCIYWGTKHRKKQKHHIQVGALWPHFFWDCYQSPACRQADKTSRERKMPSLTLAALFFSQEMSASFISAVAAPVPGLLLHLSFLPTTPWPKDWEQSSTNSHSHKDSDWPWNAPHGEPMRRGFLQHPKWYHPKSC